jgi:hypothetical protein
MTEYKKMWYVSLHEVKNENGFKMPIPNSTIYVQYFKTKKQAKEIYSKVNTESYIPFIDFHADVDVEKFGAENMFSLNPERTPVKLVEDILLIQ